LPERICRQWKRRSFQDLPPELAQFRYPKTKSAAEAGASFALIEYLKKTGEPVHIPTRKITVGAWLENSSGLMGTRGLPGTLPKTVPTPPNP
jgi:hypothetical protein